MNTLAQRLAYAGLGVLVIGLSSACMSINRPVPQPNALDDGAEQVTAAPTTTQIPPINATPTAARATSRQAVAVTRQSITEKLVVDGRVTAEEQQPVTHVGLASVVDVMVKAGQSVKRGDLLVQLDGPNRMQAGELTTKMEQARAQLQAAEARVAGTQAQGAARQGVAEQRAVIAEQRKQQDIAIATTGLLRAQENLARVQAGPSAVERQQLQGAVEAARATLNKAQENQESLAAGPDQAAIRNAQREFTAAQVAHAKARADLDTLSSGASPAAIRESELQVQRAQAQLQAAQAAKPDRNVDATVARIQIEAGIRDAQVAVATAQDRLATLKSPAARYEVDAAKQRAQDAQDVLSAAQAKLNALQAGPTESEINTSQTGVDRAQQALTVAEARLVELNARPTRQELAEAQDAARKAQAALDAIRTAPPQSPELVPLDSSEVLQIKAEIANLEDVLAMTRVTAPFDGTIVSVRLRPGDAVNSTTPVLYMTKLDVPIVRVDLSDDEVDKVTLGQTATVQYGDDSAPPVTLEGTVINISESTSGAAGAAADVQVNWPEDSAKPPFGLQAQVSFPVREKANVLVVPRSALRQAGDRATVQVQEGARRRSVSVKVGITNAESAEIVSGLSEGQLVLVAAL